MRAFSQMVDVETVRAWVDVFQVLGSEHNGYDTFAVPFTASTSNVPLYFHFVVHLRFGHAGNVMYKTEFVRLKPRRPPIRLYGVVLRLIGVAPTDDANFTNTVSLRKNTAVTTGAVRIEGPVSYTPTHPYIHMFLIN